MSTVVIYHANCPDGFAAAWVAHRMLGPGPDVEYVPADYGTDPPDVTDKDVYILDFSYKAPVMERLIARCHSLVVLDHHKTAQADLAELRERHGSGHGGVLVRFVMARSGARLTWEHFAGGQESPWLVDYTEDRDLWRWLLPQSREISAFLGSYPRTFERWDEWAKSGPGTADWERWTADGAAILRYQETVIDQAVANARQITMARYLILAVNSTVLVSEIAGKLAEGRPFGAVWSDRTIGKRQWSLRSRDDGVDVGEIASRYDGGGRRHAAGFEEEIG